MRIICAFESYPQRLCRALSPTNDHGRRHLKTVSLILASAACSSPIASITDLWPSPLGLHSSASHPAARAGAVSRPLLPRIQFISYSGQVFTAPLRDIELWSHVSCSCLGLTRRHFCNRSETLHPLRSTAKADITVSRPPPSVRKGAQSDRDRAYDSNRDSHNKVCKSHSAICSFLRRHGFLGPKFRPSISRLACHE